MPTSLEKCPKYRCRKVNRGRHTLEMRTNGTWHDIPNTTHLRKKWGSNEGGFKSVHNQMGEARSLNLLNITAWLISTRPYPLPFCLHQVDRALAPCILAPCVCTCKGKDKKLADKQWKEKMQRAYERGIKQINEIDMASKETKKWEGKQARKQNWCPRGTNVGLDRMSITSLCWIMDNTLASKTHSWTCEQACKDA